jgi:hypothetical protein
LSAADELLALGLKQEVRIGFTIAQTDFRFAGAVRDRSFFVLLPAAVWRYGCSFAAGAANGWQAKSAFFEGFVAVSVLATLIGFGLPRLIEEMPVSLVNDPARLWYILAGFLVSTVV